MSKLADGLLTALACAAALAFGSAVCSPLTYYIERSRIQSAWCASVHGGEMHGDVCVSGDVAHTLPVWLTREGPK